MQPASVEMAVPFVVETLARTRMVWVREGSESMAPIVRAGDRLCLAPADRMHIRPGSLVAFCSDARLVVHRVLACGPAGLVTKGDALSRRDGPMSWDAVVGRVVAVAHSVNLTELERFPWPALGRMLAVLSRVAEAVAPPPAAVAPVGWRRTAWLLARAPFHVLARIAR
jgi:hypothetical protein